MSTVSDVMAALDAAEAAYPAGLAHPGTARLTPEMAADYQLSSTERSAAAQGLVGALEGLELDGEAQSAVAAAAADLSERIAANAVRYAEAAAGEPAACELWFHGGDQPDRDFDWVVNGLRAAIPLPG